MTYIIPESRIRQSNRHTAGRPPSVLRYEKAILSVTLQPAQDDDLPTSYSDAIKKMGAAALTKSLEFELDSLKKAQHVGAATFAKRRESHQ